MRVRSRLPWRITSWAAAKQMKAVNPSMASDVPSRTWAATASCMDMRLSAAWSRTPAGWSPMSAGSPGKVQRAELDLVGGRQSGAGVGDTGRVGPRTPGEVEAGEVAEAPVVHHKSNARTEGVLARAQPIQARRYPSPARAPSTAASSALYNPRPWWAGSVAHCQM